MILRRDEGILSRRESTKALSSTLELVALDDRKVLGRVAGAMFRQV